jgi:PAS domain S-box-containing protein
MGTMSVKLLSPSSPVFDDPTGRRTIALRGLISFLCVFSAGAVSFAPPLFGARLALPILQGGIAVAAIFRWGRRMWPAVFAAGVAIELSLSQPPIAAIGVGIGLAASAAFCAGLLEQRGFNSAFGRAEDVPLFIMTAGVGMILLPTFGMLGLELAGTLSEGSHTSHWLRWWANSTASVLLISPILMGGQQAQLRRFREHWKAAALWLLGVSLCCGAVMVAPGQLGRPLIMLIGIFLIVGGSIRFGFAVAACGALAITMMTALSLTFGRGVLGQFNELQGLVTVWSFGAALAGLNFIITALLAERDVEGLRRLRAEHRYAQIFDGSPHPLWVHERETLNLLLVNAAAVRQYGWSREELLSSSVRVFTPPGESRVLPDFEQTPTDGECVPEPFETRHLTKSGRELEVEIWTRSLDFDGRVAELVFAIDVTGRRAFGQALVEAVAGEQRRIGQEMHDGLGQELTGLSLSLRAMANRARKEQDGIAENIDELARQATSCIAETHRIVQGLSPLADDEDSLDSALEALAQRSSSSGVRVQFSCHNQGGLIRQSKVRHHLYRIAQEAVQNALKHSNAKTIEIELWAGDGGVRLSITDDGSGFPSERAVGLGLGMRTMRFRASAIGGRLTLDHGSGRHSVNCEVRSRSFPRERI